MRHCEHCGKPLIRKPYEHAGQFAVRRHCGTSCATRTVRSAEPKRTAAEKRIRRQEYMRAYYAAHPERLGRRTKEQRDRYNAQRRDRYAANEEIRRRACAEVREWQRNNPTKRLAQRVKKYGLTSEQYGELLSAQQGTCAICGGTESKGRPGERLHVDHDHATGAVRGLLCSECNRGIGHFGERDDVLIKAAMYLRRFRAMGRLV